jgi:hypothetical protein
LVVFFFTVERGRERERERTTLIKRENFKTKKIKTIFKRRELK